MADNKAQIKELIDSVGAVAEMSLVFFRSVLGAGGTIEESMRLTQVFIAAQIWGKPQEEGNGGD